jgi:hypothetical protein
MRQTISELATMASFAISAFTAVIEMRGCPALSWYHWIPTAFLGLGIIFAFFALYQSRWSQRKGYTEIANQHFLNCDVLLDGYIYLACVFDNVTFVYNGGDCGGFNAHCLFGPSLGFRTGDPKVGQMLAFLKEIKMLRQDAFAMYTPKKSAK